MILRAHIRNAIRVILLLFVAGSVAYSFMKGSVWKGDSGRESPRSAAHAVAKAAAPAMPEHVVAYYFHGNYRCATCLKLEEYSRVAIEEGFPRELSEGILSFEVVNVDEPQNRHFISDYALVTKSLVLVQMAGDEQVRFKNLDFVWKFLGSRDEFKAYVQDEVRGFLAEVRR
jgi:hypothetical protein